MRTYIHGDLRPLRWEEMGAAFDSLVSDLTRHVHQHGAFDAVTPILRSGAILGGMLAVHLGLQVVLPVQLKYGGQPPRPQLRLPLPSGIRLPERPHILVCDTNTSTGETAAEAVRHVRTRYPSARIVFATLVRVHGHQEVPDGVVASFHGMVSDEGFTATEQELAEGGIRAGVPLFPWERADDELAELNGGPRPS